MKQKRKRAIRSKAGVRDRALKAGDDVTVACEAWLKKKGLSYPFIHIDFRSRNRRGKHMDEDGKDEEV